MSQTLEDYELVGHADWDKTVGARGLSVVSFRNKGFVVWELLLIRRF